jgi:hypothetical protein
MRTPVRILRGSRTVDDFVVVKALGFTTFQYRSTAAPQTVQRQLLRINGISLFSITCEIRFGTSGSEVQILSPRPLFSLACKHFQPTPKPTVDDFVDGQNLSVQPYSQSSQDPPRISSAITLATKYLHFTCTSGKFLSLVH